MRFRSLTLGLPALSLALPAVGWAHDSDDRGGSRRQNVQLGALE